MTSRRNSRLPFFLILSLLLHLLLFFGMPWSLPPREEGRDLEVLIKNNLPNRIADILEPPVQEKPKKPDFLGVYDSSVEEETVAPTPAQPSRASKGGGEESRDRAEPGSRSAGPRLGSRRTEDSDQAEGDESAENNPELDAFPEDYFPDYKVGPHTYLNTLRFPKIGYFVRLKKIFRTTFDPIPALRQQAYQISKGQVEVILGVTVAPDGRLDDLILISSSGLPLYDEEALRTIRASAPFAAPPKELLDASGKLRMSWTFTVYL